MRVKYSYPYIVWMIIFIVLPLFLILFYAFTVPNNNGGVSFSIENIVLMASPMYRKVIFRSFLVALESSAICFLIGYPVAYILARSNFKNVHILVFLFILPMWMNSLIKTYSWLSILEKNGILNQILRFFSLPTYNILYTRKAVILGMVYNYLPFMILPIYTVLSNMDESLIEAASDLGANHFQAFRKVIFPLSMHGVSTGFTMTFMPAVTAFLISNLLGGGQNILIGNLIERQFLQFYNWHLGSSISVVLMILIIAAYMMFTAYERRKLGELH